MFIKLVALAVPFNVITPLFTTAVIPLLLYVPFGIDIKFSQSVPNNWFWLSIISCVFWLLLFIKSSVWLLIASDVAVSLDKLDLAKPFTLVKGAPVFK